MNSSLVQDIIQLWSDLNPSAGYTGGYLKTLTQVFFESAENLHVMRKRIDDLRARVGELGDAKLERTAAGILTALTTQINMPRASGAGPSGTGMAGVYAAADGIFYIVLKGDYGADWSLDFLSAVKEQVEFETRRWQGQEFTILVRKECLNTVGYMRGTLKAYLQARKNDDVAKEKVAAIEEALVPYEKLFWVEGLDSSDFETYWKVFVEWDRITGPQRTQGYPESLHNYYQLEESAEWIETTAMAWLDLDLPVISQIASQISQLSWFGELGALGDVWNQISAHYAVDFSSDLMKKMVDVTNAYGKQYIIGFTDQDHVLFDATPDYLVNLVTGGEDFAVNYLNPQTAYSQLYLTASKNTSSLTMINILVHEASHGFNFVLSARHAGNPLLNVNTSLEVPMTEGQAYYREFQYWAAAQALLGRTDLNRVQQDYLNLYGSSLQEQSEGVLCAEFETYIWRIIRYIRALCDVQVNGGKRTYTDFIDWAAKTTGLSRETLHGECFTFMASPGYAPCYAVGGARYAYWQKTGLLNGVAEIDFNTRTSAMGFFAWPVDVANMKAIAMAGRS